MGWIKWCFPECFSGRKVNITGSTKTLEMMGGTNNGIFVGNMLQQWKMLLNYYLRKMCSVLDTFQEKWVQSSFAECWVSSVQSLSCVQLSATPWTAASQTCLSITNSRSLLKLMSIELVMPSNHLILCYALLLLPSVFPSIRVFSSELVLCIMWPKYWSFSFSISPCNEYSRLISFRMDWLALLAVQGTLKSLLPHHCSKASVL